MNRLDIYLREVSWNFLITHNIKSLPIDAFSLAKKLGYKLYTYNEFSLIIGKPIEYLIDKYDNDGFVFWSKNKQCFVICYNSNLPSNIVRWTITHEIAHVVLGHVSQNTPTLTRIRKINRPQFEIEADGFTRRVLCPSIVLHNCQAFETQEIMALCGISQKAAKFRSDYMKTLEKRGMYRTDPLEIIVEKQFETFVVKYIRNKFMYEIALEPCA